MIRVFIHSGEVLDRVDTYDDPAYASTDEVAAAEVAAALGVPVSEIRVRHPDRMPKVTKVIPPAPVSAAAPTVEDELRARLAVLEAKVG